MQKCLKNFLKNFLGLWKQGFLRLRKVFLYCFGCDGEQMLFETKNTTNLQPKRQKL